MRNKLQFLARSHVMLLNGAAFGLKAFLIRTKQGLKLLFGAACFQGHSKQMRPFSLII